HYNTSVRRAYRSGIQPMRIYYSILGAVGLVVLPAMRAETQEQFRPAYRDEKWGYIDAERQFVIAPQFDDAGPFAQGLAPVKRDGLYGYIDMGGSWRIPPRYQSADVFSEGLGAVKQEERYGYINTS